MYKFEICLEETRNQVIDMDLTNIRNTILTRNFVNVFSVTKKVTGDIFKMLDEVVFQYEAFRMKNNGPAENRFTFGDKIVLIEQNTGKKIELFHCMDENGFKII